MTSHDHERSSHDPNIFGAPIILKMAEDTDLVAMEHL